MAPDNPSSAVQRSRRLADRLFVGGCTAAYVGLLAVVIVAALRSWGG